MARAPCALARAFLKRTSPVPFQAGAGQLAQNVENPPFTLFKNHGGWPSCTGSCSAPLLLNTSLCFLDALIARGWMLRTCAQGGHVLCRTRRASAKPLEPDMLTPPLAGITRAHFQRQARASHISLLLVGGGIFSWLFHVGRTRFWRRSLAVAEKTNKLWSVRPRSGMRVPETDVPSPISGWGLASSRKALKPSVYTGSAFFGHGERDPWALVAQHAGDCGGAHRWRGRGRSCLSGFCVPVSWA